MGKIFTCIELVSKNGIEIRHYDIFEITRQLVKLLITLELACKMPKNRQTVSQGGRFLHTI